MKRGLLQSVCRHRLKNTHRVVVKSYGIERMRKGRERAVSWVS